MQAYYLRMLIRYWLLVLVLGIALPGRSDVIQLRDKATVTGKILAEKKDQVVVDIGYTVLTIPRSQIAKILPDDAPPAKGRPIRSAPPASEVSPPPNGQSGNW